MVWQRMAAVVLAAGAWGALAAGPPASAPVRLTAGPEAAHSLGIPGSASTQAVKLDPFGVLPAPKPRVGAAEPAAGVHAGTQGLALPGPGAGGGRVTLAILGDLAPGDESSREEYLREAVSEINLLRPEAVLSVGNLVPGMVRDGARYVREAQRVREALDGLKMPWYPCAGEMDVASGVRATPGSPDRRFEALYQRYMGPLYYSLDVGGVHAIVLNSEEGVGAGNSMGDEQLRWLKEDLNRAFERGSSGGAAGGGGGRAQWVVVLVHRPLWREESRGANWQRVHEMLVEFNRRPVVNVEGFSQGSEARAPRVMAVFAGGERAYAMDPTTDGIHYYVVGPTGAMPKIGEDATEAVRHFTLVKFDPAAAGSGGELSAVMHPAVIRLGAGGEAARDAADRPASIVADDFITAREREEIDAVAGWGEEVIGIDGIINERGEAVGGNGLTLRLSNPLSVPVNVRLQVTNTDAYGAGWELTWPAQIARQLAPGARETVDFSVRQTSEPGPLRFSRPQANIGVRWLDGRGRVHELRLNRRITVAPSMEVPVSARAVAKGNQEGWTEAAASIGYAWKPLGDEPLRDAPEFNVAADAERLFVRARVPDLIPSYWPAVKLDAELGGLASDAVSVAWVTGTGDVQRVWALPFAPHGPELWTNMGVAGKQTDLLRLDPKWGVEAALQREKQGYVVTISLPRRLIFGDGAGAALTGETRTMAQMNFAFHDNDESLKTWMWSWAREEAGTAAWGEVRLVQPAQTAPATRGK